MDDRDSLRAEKKSVRKQRLAARDALTAAEREAASAAICDRLVALPDFARARRVALFAAFRSEVDLDAAIVRSVAAGKTVYLPRTLLAEHVLEFYPVASLDDLIVGGYGIREPDPAGRPPADPEEFDLIVTPGAAFDEAGRRIGYGGGYYDAVLARIRPDCRIVAVSFEVQIAPRVPCEAHDLPVHLVVTERRVIRPGTGER